MARWWNDFPQSQPRRPTKDGIRAKSRKGEIGERWWSKRFVAALEALTDPRRLDRGRSYARTGQVLDPAVAPGRVTARVQGSRRTPYQVRIDVTQFSDEEWARVEQAMAGQAIFMAALLAGEMPHDIEEAFATAGLSLFPARPDELRTDCSCPDWANPCKHVAATLYILAERFDDDPFLIFAWRGRGRDRLIERLRERRDAGGGRRAGAPGVEPDHGAGPRGAGPAGAGDTRSTGDPEGAPDDAFWRPGAELDQLRITPAAATVPDALLLQLGPLPPEVRGHDIAGRLAAAYRAISAAAERKALAGAGGDEGVAPDPELAGSHSRSEAHR